MEVLLREYEAAGHYVDHNLCGGSDGLVPLGAGRYRNLRQHKLCPPLAPRGTSDADSQTRIVPGAKMLGETAQTVVTPFPSALFQPKLVGWQVKVVVDNQNLFGNDFLKFGEARQRPTRDVHEVVRHGKSNSRTGHASWQVAKPHLRGAGATAVAAKLAALFCGELFNHPGANVVPGVFVLRTGVTKSNHQANTPRG